MKRILAAVIFFLGSWAMLLIPSVFAASFTMDDYVNAVLYREPLPSQTQKNIPPDTPQKIQPTPQVSIETPPASSSTETAIPVNYSPGQVIKTPNDYYNAVLNHKTTPVYYGNTPAAPVVNLTPSPSQGTQQPVPTPQPAPAGLTASETSLYELINSARSSEGIAPVKIDMRIMEAAREKAQDMIKNNYFGHTSPTYGSPGQMLRKYGISFQSAGENLCKAGDVYKAHMLLLNSTAGHRKIMLDPDYTEVGVAVAQRGSYVIVVELFVQS